MPNAKLTSDTIINYSSSSKRRINLVVGVGYQDNIDHVKDTLQKIVSSDSRVLEDPARTIAVLELVVSSVNFAVRPWVATTDYWPVRFDLMEKIKK